MGRNINYICKKAGNLSAAKRYAPATGMGALAGAGLGALLWKLSKKDKDKFLKYLLLGGVLGGGAGFLYKNLHNKNNNRLYKRTEFTSLGDVEPEDYFEESRRQRRAYNNALLHEDKLKVLAADVPDGPLQDKMLEEAVYWSREKDKIQEDHDNLMMKYNKNNKIKKGLESTSRNTGNLLGRATNGALWGLLIPAPGPIGPAIGAGIGATFGLGENLFTNRTKHKPGLGASIGSKVIKSPDNIWYGDPYSQITPEQATLTELKLRDKFNV